MKYLNKLYRWLFTDEERTFVPDWFVMICFSIGISWWVCSYMLDQRDMLWLTDIEAKRQYEWSVIDSLQARLDQVEYILKLDYPDDEPNYEHLEELVIYPEWCGIVDPTNKNIVLPGLPVNIGDLYDEMCTE